MKRRFRNHEGQFAGTLFSPFLTLCFGIALLLISSSAEARLGESFSRCQGRYGNPIGTIEIPGLIKNGVRFHRGEFSITCGFEDNKCVTMVVMHLSPTDPFQEGISRDDLDLFMNDNFGHTSWFYTLLSSRESLWKARDLQEPRSYIASYSHSLKMLTMKIERG